MRLNDTTREFFMRLANISPPDQAALFRTLDEPASQRALHQKMPQFYSILHTAVVPTVLKGGFKSNVIPPEAEAEIDIRALPDEELTAFFQQMNRIVDDPSVTILPLDLPIACLRRHPALSTQRCSPHSKLPRRRSCPAPSPSL
jgi:acetylornithine deacetylase/succinyl-diaminopimelate desuccinylase-like protein